MKRLRLLEEDSKGKNGVYDLDISKVIISARGTGINGEELGEWLSPGVSFGNGDVRGGVCDSDHDSDGYGGRIAADPECIVGDRRKTE